MRAPALGSSPLLGRPAISISNAARAGAGHYPAEIACHHGSPGRPLRREWTSRFWRLYPKLASSFGCPGPKKVLRPPLEPNRLLLIFVSPPCGGVPGA